MSDDSEKTNAELLEEDVVEIGGKVGELDGLDIGVVAGDEVKEADGLRVGVEDG